MCGPDFRLLLAIDLEGGVACGRPRSIASCTQLILIDPGVRDETHPSDRKLEGERITMRMARLMTGRT